ncbi:hypothetical protein GWC77_20770 [Paraburkholderia sp. NMBU_R16]|uniref:hypothetical protein n=1 Tax=Paraburkholderia sp. NMBU_R16 TaxID=2698676 RepID=UPI001565DAAE|nr:hypothetical protein [Paraburkholderia sp. NMBU_R16]NRO98361.1 hypothetical protein [Paraburkholderia sp. NMBU_R16]
MMVDHYVLRTTDMTNAPNGGSSISRRLDGLDGLAAQEDGVPSQNLDGRADAESPYAPPAATGLLAGLNRRSIRDALDNGRASRFAQTDEATHLSGRPRQDAVTPETRQIPVDSSAPEPPGDSGRERAARGDAGFHVVTGAASPDNAQRLTPRELSQAGTKFDAGLWTLDDAVRELGVTDPDDREKLREMAAQSARFAGATLVRSEPDDSPHAPAPVALPAEQPVRLSDATSTALSPRVQARMLLRSCLEAFRQAEAALEGVLSNQYQNDGLSEHLTKAEQHIDEGTQQANEAFALLIEETKAAPSLEFSRTVRERQVSFQNSTAQFRREIGKAGTNNWAFDRLSDALTRMRRGLETLTAVLDGQTP